MTVCYVSAFLDINRESWNTFSRTFENYFKAFTPLVDLILESDDLLFIFIDKKHSSRVRNYIESCTNVHNSQSASIGRDPFIIQEIDENYLKTNSTIFQRIDREKEIMESEEYRQFLSNRLNFPENSKYKYNIITHCKIDFVNIAISRLENMDKQSVSEPDSFCWIDFGYLCKPEIIPKKLLNPTLFKKNKITFSLVNPIDESDKNIEYTLKVAPEKIAGGLFFGNKKAMREYQKIYHQIHSMFQEYNIADDDQHLALRCYFKCPELFDTVCLGWHKAITYFQKN